MPLTHNTFRKEISNEEIGFLPTNNQVLLVGTLKFKFVHYYTSSVTDEKFYKSVIVIQRRYSEKTDNVTIVASEKFIHKHIKCFKRGSKIKLYGTLKSICVYDVDAKKTKMKLYVLAQNNIEPHETFESDEVDNLVYIEGKVCSFPLSIKAVEHPKIMPNTRKRMTTKTVTNILVSLRGEDDRIIRIPCIAWGKFSDIVKTLVPEDKIIIRGRIQSRTYHEPNPRNPKELVNREVHEVSIFEIVEVNKKSF